MSRNRILALATVAAALTSSGWLYAWKQAGPQRFVQSMERHSSRVLYFGNGGIAGQYAVETGQPVWKEQYAAQIKNSAQVPDGRRVRMGNNFWSTIETTIDLEIGGAALPVG